MADEQQENRIIHSLLWLLSAIAVGFGISRYLAPPAYAGATVVGSIFAGSALAALVYLRGNHDRKGEKIAEPSIDQKRGSATADKAILRSSAASSVFVFLNVYRRIGDSSGPIPPSFLASVSLPDGADYLDPGQVSGCARPAFNVDFPVCAWYESRIRRDSVRLRRARTSLDSARKQF